MPVIPWNIKRLKADYSFRYVNFAAWYLFPAFFRGGRMVPEKTPAYVKLTILKMAELFISSPFIKKPTVRRKMTSAVAVVSETMSLCPV